MSAKTKISLCSLAAVLLLAVAGTSGCGKKVTVDTVKLEYSFQSADPTNQTAVTQAIDAIEKADFASASDKLKKVSADPKLTAEQKTAVADVIQQLEKH
jgi:hypothetical protein